VRDGVVSFRRNEKDSRVIRLYTSACRTVADVELAIKSDAERHRDLVEIGTP
jgi:hypothetical protein